MFLFECFMYEMIFRIYNIYLAPQSELHITVTITKSLDVNTFLLCTIFRWQSVKTQSVKAYAKEVNINWARFYSPN